MTMTTGRRIGWIGLGRMGEAMATRSIAIWPTC